MQAKDQLHRMFRGSPADVAVIFKITTAKKDINMKVAQKTILRCVRLAARSFLWNNRRINL